MKTFPSNINKTYATSHNNTVYINNVLKTTIPDHHSVMLSNHVVKMIHYTTKDHTDTMTHHTTHKIASPYF